VVTVGQATGSVPIDVLGAVLAVGLVLVWCVVAWRSVRAFRPVSAGTRPG
jgi:hypothetical protein